jgi:hypothetical protein
MMSCLGSLARPLPLGAGFVMTDILMPQAHTSWIPVTSDRVNRTGPLGAIVLVHNTFLSPLYRKWEEY